MNRRRPLQPSRRAARGFSLIIALLMLAVIGLASAAIMRNATTGDQAANNNRLQTQASQYAQLALRFCEGQLARTPDTRVAAVQRAATPAAWTLKQNWLDTHGHPAVHTLVANEIGSRTQPRIAPQCLIEVGALAGTYTVTARGYSADFKADPGTGATRSGSSVWLQATVWAQGDGADPAAGAAAPDPTTVGPLTVRQRLWQQLLSPPF